MTLVTYSSISTAWRLLVIIFDTGLTLLVRRFQNLPMKKYLDTRELDENFFTYYKIPRYIEW